MRARFRIGTVAVALALAAAPAAARQAQSRPAGGERTGSAVSRGGESRGGESRAGTESRGGGSAGQSGTSSNSGSGNVDRSSGPRGSGLGSRSAAPTRDDTRERSRDAAREQAVRRGSGENTGRAVPRGSNTGDSRDAAVRSGASASSGSTDTTSDQRRAVPANSRSRDGRRVIGSAVERGALGLPPIAGSYYIYRPYYYPYGFWGSGYGFGLGYLYYDPFWYGSYGYGYYGPPYSGYYGPAYYGGGQSYSQSYRGMGALRLKIKPRDAQVYVDGYFVGDVDSFDGAFQKLNLDAGSHRVEIRAEGYEPVQFEVLITPGQTITYKGDLRRIQ